MEVRFRLLDNQRVAHTHAVAQEQDHRRQLGYHGGGLAKTDVLRRVSWPIEKLGIAARQLPLHKYLPFQRAVFQLARDRLNFFRTPRRPAKSISAAPIVNKLLHEVGQRSGEGGQL